MATARLRDVSIEYVTHGSPEDPAIVLIRGLGTQLIEWPAALIGALVGAGLFVVTFDNRDAGLSSECTDASGDRPYRLEDMADDVVGLLDHLGIARAHVLGISLGGMIAQHVAFAHSDRMRSLISVMSSSGNPDLPRPAPEIWSRLTARPEGREAIIAANADNRLAFGSPGYPESAEVRLAAARAAYQRSYRPQGVARQMQAALADGSRVERLRRVRVPTLVIHGKDDPLVPLAAGEDTARCVPGAELSVLPGMGHNIPEALAPRIAGIALDFVQRLP
jgi:pimeloyl-ACP methyl ester carboxylesterase